MTCLRSGCVAQNQPTTTRRRCSSSQQRKFIKAARQASKAAIELSFYREGSRVFLFDVEGLVWK
ncbi:MAG: hypothetical protein IPK72_08610 [Candidatus Eisenbacteria bacterium]|nr:hypothetical protein [Candidatus Eisenbacteria bacterium]